MKTHVTLPNQELAIPAEEGMADEVETRRLHTFGIRLLDIVLAISGLILSIPLFLVIPLLIKLDSPGRVFFVHRRLGQGGKPFHLLKFRTMRENRDVGRWTVKNDPRITSVGRILRKFHLDEIPQLVNVLQGDISIVGPRPYTNEVHEQLCRIDPYFARRLSVKPGLTGWAQLAGREADNPPEHHLHLFNCYDRRYLDSPLTAGKYLAAVVLTIKYLFLESVRRTF